MDASGVFGQVFNQSGSGVILVPACVALGGLRRVVLWMSGGPVVYGVVLLPRLGCPHGFVADVADVGGVCLLGALWHL